MKYVIIISFVIAVGVIIITLALVSNNDSQSQESWKNNVCDLYPTPNVVIPKEIDSNQILESWEFAKKYDMFKFVEPPSNISENLELKFLYLEHPYLLAFYGDVDWEHDLCGALFLEHGFILSYSEGEIWIMSNIIEDSKLFKIIESLPMSIDDMRLKINDQILQK